MTAGLSKVQPGWTGAVTVTVGAVMATVTPDGRDSAAAIWRRLVRLAERKHGGGNWVAGVDSSGRLTIKSDAAFDLAATLLTQSRLGLTGIYTAATSYVADVAHTGGLYPLMIDVNTAQAGIQRGAAMADGAAAFEGARLWQRSSIRIADTHANAVAHATSLDGAAVWDVWCDGRIRTRVKAQEVAPLARVGRATHLMLTEVQAIEVSS